MSTNETNSFKNTVFDAQMRILMTIKDFRQDFINHSNSIQTLSKDLVDTYENGAAFLNANGNHDFKKEWEENLNDVMVQANQMNNILAVSDDFMMENNQEHDFSADSKEFESRKNWLKEAALKFEKMGAKALPEDLQDEWNARFLIFDNRIEKELDKEAKYVHLIYDFEQKYSQEDLTKITNIVLENTSENVNWEDPVAYEQQYIKAIREFQQEFKPQNLWDNLLEILAGGVHPSPSERMMLEQWADGEQKTREDM